MSYNKKGEIMNFARPVVAFALLYQCSDSFKGDLLAGISLLIKPIVGDLAGQIYNSTTLATRMEAAYGIPIAGAALEGFLPRLIAAGILAEVEQGNGVKHAIYLEQEEVAVLPEQEEEFQELIDDFLNHAKASQTEHQLDISDPELTSKFLRHLSTLDFSSVSARPILEEQEKTTDGTIKGPEAKARIDLNTNLALGATIDILVASYIAKLNATAPNKLELLAKIADGALGIELVLDLQAPQHVPKFTNTMILLDTPILLAYLDLSSTPEVVATKSFVEQLQAAGASIGAFQHTIEEAEGVLHAIKLATHTKSAYGRTVARFSNSIYRAYFDTMVNRVGAAWVKQFEIIQKASAHFYKNFSQEDEEKLVSVLMFSMEDNVASREKDAKSVAETIRRLGGAHIPAEKISTCPYIFVTNNSAVQRRAVHFLKDNGYVSPGELAPVVTDRYMAGLCWLISGGTSKNSPTTARLLANCAAALRLRPELASRTKLFLSKLDPAKAEHFEALMTNDRASQYLMEATFGNPELITENNIEEIYDEMQHRAVEKISMEKDQEYQAQLQQLNLTIEKKQENLNKLEEEKAYDDIERKKQKQQLIEATEKTSSLEIKITTQEETLAIQANKVAEFDEKIKELSKEAEKHTVRAETMRKNAHKNAESFANRTILAIRIAGVVFIAICVLLLGYLDKFILPSLSNEAQTNGSWVIIFSQVLLGLIGASVFIEKPTAWFFTRVKKRVMRSRLAALGIEEENLN